jgi:hypothetical protein
VNYSVLISLSLSLFLMLAFVKEYSFK